MKATTIPRRRKRVQSRVLLLTGVPGSGKTTVVRRAAARLRGTRIVGFLADEIRTGDRRDGFRLESFDGRSIVLAHVDIRSPHRVGKYGVDVAALDDLVDSVLGSRATADVYLIDEIGKMECFSSRFVAAAAGLLESRALVVATIAARGAGLIQDARRRPDAEVVTVTRANRDGLPETVVDWVRIRLG
jgi:nucleoside-triphosphatase